MIWTPPSSISVEVTNTYNHNHTHQHIHRRRTKTTVKSGRQWYSLKHGRTCVWKTDQYLVWKKGLQFKFELTVDTRYGTLQGLPIRNLLTPDALVCALLQRNGFLEGVLSYVGVEVPTVNLQLPWQALILSSLPHTSTYLLWLTYCQSSQSGRPLVTYCLSCHNNNCLLF